MQVTFSVLFCRKSEYKIFYLMWNGCSRSQCDPLDPDTLPTLTAAEIQRHVTFTSPRNETYIIADSTNAVDFSYHFSLSLSRQVRESDLTKFESVVKSVWSKKSMWIRMFSSLT